MQYEGGAGGPLGGIPSPPWPARSEADLLDIRNFGQKSIDEVKAKLAELGLSLKDSPAGFDPSAALGSYDDDFGDQY